MDSATREQLQQELRSRRDDIVDSWYRALAHTSYVPSGADQVRHRLAELVERACALIVAERFDDEGAWQAGAALADLHYIQPEALGRTIGLLARVFTDGLPAEEAALVQPGLARLLGAMSTAIFQNACQVVLDEQEEIRGALVTELRAAGKALQDARDQLEARVAARTEELARANEELRKEIAERTRVEIALRESEEKFRSLVESLHEVIYEIDPSGRLVYVSPSIELFVGQGSEEVIGRHFQEFVQEEDVAGMMQSFRSVLDGQGVENEYRVVAGNDESRWLRTSSKPVFREGRVTGIRGVLSDVTKRKLAEQALRESEARWRSLVENAPHIVVTLDREGRILFINHLEAGATISVDDVVGTHFTRYITPEQRETALEAVRLAFDAGTSAHYEFATLGASGRRYWHETHVGPVFSDGEVVAVMLLTSDVTERRQIEEIKDNLIRDVSHELRTPLAKMHMSLELMLEMIKQEVFDRQKVIRLGERTFSNVQRLLHIVETILDLSVLEAGVQPYQRDEIGLAELVEEVALYMEPLARAGGIDLRTAVPVDLPPVVGDREQLFRVLTNLVDNAVKFSEEGVVAVSAESRSGELEIVVSDCGQGILPENLDRVFDRFFQEKTRHHGVGVGLTISKTIVEAHGGRIWAESPGREQGATFRFTLPVEEESGRGGP